MGIEEVLKNGKVESRRYGNRTSGLKEALDHIQIALTRHGYKDRIFETRTDKSATLTSGALKSLRKAYAFYSSKQ
jgi:hypothetical protein